MSSTPPAPSLEILIVEDSPTQTMLLRNILTKTGYRVISAVNGQEALDLLGEARPALVITDIQMPVMNGYDLCLRIKTNEAIESIPVILLTSLSDPKDILKSLECGADSFIVKPYDVDFLLSRIQHVLANLELRKEAQGQDPTEIYFAGHKYKLTLDRVHSVDLLLSTYETAVQKNLELSRAKETLEAQAQELRRSHKQMAEELEMARDLQNALLPSTYPVFPPNVSEEQSALRFCHRYYATKELGGDFFDIVQLSNTKAGIFVCDVMGHGVRAALVTAIMRGLLEELRPIATDASAFLNAMNQALHRILHQMATRLFASAIYAIVDVANGVVRFANAGHPAPLHVRRAAGVVEPLKNGAVKPSPVLGIMANATYPETEHAVEPGDLLLLFTDGLYELESPAGDLYDTEQLRTAVSQQLTRPTPELMDQLLVELKSFGKLEAFPDDVCIVGVDVARTR